jgi:hypothetical protein
MRRYGEAIEHGVNRTVAAGGNDSIASYVCLAGQTLNVAHGRSGSSNRNGASQPFQSGNDLAELSDRSGASRGRIGNDQYAAAHTEC